MNMNLRNKIAGAVYGFAIGDAMGATTEFMDSVQIRRRYGKVKDVIGGGWLSLNPGDVTDDTQMTMCVMQAIMKQPKDIDEFKKYCSDNFIEWLYSGPKDIGGQCMKGIYALKNGRQIPVEKHALGNGSLMRAMPLALLDLPYWNVIQGTLTHNNHQCSEIILEYTELIKSYLYDKPHKYINHKTKALYEPTGYVVFTFANSVYWSNKKSFKKAIIGAVNHGGDADTIAAITGSLAGAKFGFDNIPEKWINALNPSVRRVLDEFIVFCFNCLQI